MEVERPHAVVIIAVILVFALASCMSPGTSSSADRSAFDAPDWVAELIAQWQSEPVANPPRSLLRYRYRGQTVYFAPAQCCDQRSTLYRGDGSVMCAPDGGFMGAGDGRCKDFFQTRRDETLIWQDDRL